MSATRKSALSVAVILILVAVGAWLWIRYARAWDLGGSSPILSYDAAQYAVAARELADRGRLVTPFALPLDLSRHANPPWPLSLVQPGLVVAEAVLFKLSFSSPDAPAETREWLALVLPVLSYVGLALVFALSASLLVMRLAPGATALARWAGLVVGLALLLDSEAQHFAVGGFTELPFTLGLSVALLAIASGWAGRRPLLFGLLLGVTGAFRANMLWLAPILALCAAWTAEPGRRWGSIARVMVGYALPLAPWWIYKWSAFGTPAWDLSWISLWDGVGSRTWFTLNHLPELPELPSGGAAFQAIAAKVARNVPTLLLELARGPRALWLGALAIALAVVRAERDPTTMHADGRDGREMTALRAAGVATFAVIASSVLVTALSVPISRYLFPARVPAEAAGLLALGILVARAPAALLGDVAKRVAWTAIAVLAIGWGTFRTIDGWDAAHATAAGRGVPSSAAMSELVARIERDLGPGEPIMSNLGPVLAWYARRPVIHLALSPDDVDACRRRLDFRAVLLVFREPTRAWPEWQEVLERPDDAAHRPEWNIARAVRFETSDGFIAIWLDLGTPGSPVARR